MSKWNKNSKEPSEEFIQNEERRRLLIIEAAKRRRDKERKLQEINDDIRRKEEQAIQRQRLEKKEAYTKYLRNNMHDKYEAKKREKAIQREEPSVKEVSKWKRKGRSEEKELIVSQVESKTKSRVEMTNKENTSTKAKAINPAKKAMADEFEEMWGEEEDKHPKTIDNDLCNDDEQMISSKLLDSLDLDYGTVQRCQDINNEMRREKGKENMKQVNHDLEKIKQLIGYESMVATEMDLHSEIASKKQRERKTQEEIGKVSNAEKPKQRSANEQQTLNHLKNKKEAKILEWAGTEAEEADDLFSNCSSRKKLAPQDTVPKTGSKKVLEPIPERKTSIQQQNRSQQRRTAPTGNRSVEKQHPEKSQKYIPPKPAPVARHNRTTSQQKRQEAKQQEVKQPQNKNMSSNSIERNPRPKSKQKPPAPLANQGSKDKYHSQQNFRKPISPSQSADNKKPQQRPSGPVKTQQAFKIHKNPPLLPPVRGVPSQSIATHEQFFDIQSFIKHDLVNLNQQERRLQQQIRDLHVGSKRNVAEVEKKYEIRTGFQTSESLVRYLDGQEPKNDGYSKRNQYKTEDQIEQSIERLDDLLIRRDIQNKDKALTHISEQSHLNGSSGIASIIDPLGRPEDLQKQILQLAENISRFEEEPADDVVGYGYHKRMKKKETHGEINPYPNPKRPDQKADEGYRRNSKREKSQGDVVQNLAGPPVLSYSASTNAKKGSVLNENQSSQSIEEDSLDTMEQGKIQVNEKLRNMLFDD